MTLQELYQQYLPLPSQPASPHILWSGLNGSARAVALRRWVEQNDSTTIIVMHDEDEAQYMFADLEALGTPFLFYFPCSHRRQRKDESGCVERTKALTALSGDKNVCVVTFPKALDEPVVKKEYLQGNRLHVRVGEQYAVSDLGDKLNKLGFNRVDFVYEPGQYALRGGIVDIYSYNNDDPYRLDFFGDDLDSCRTFDIETQLSKQKIDEVDIVGQTEAEEDLLSFSSYLEGKAIRWVSDDWTCIREMADWYQLIKESDTIEIRAKSTFPGAEEVTYHTEPQPVFHKDFSLLLNDLHRKMADGYQVYILADQKKQTDRLQAVMDDENEHSGELPIFFTAVDRTLHAGWVDKASRKACYTDHEIFERYHRVSLRSDNARRGKAVMTLRELNELRQGDYVVHTDHGIGQFGGLVTTTLNGKRQEMLRIVYRGGDTLFVSIHNLHRISKYKGREGSSPTLSRLGSGAWEKLRERTKDKVKDIARDLIRLYAQRKQEKGFAFLPDGYMQHELEAGFLYEDTPDQAKATQDVKRDMESPRPMDRLICGDVGFGKTEVAMRAAFKAATDGKQVAVLVPTTVLALQHYHSFKERMKNFPVSIDYLSRGKNAKETKDVLQRLADGKIDILIGTHKIVGKQVVWKDLGLLIIDEEQKLGVAVKDKLKTLRASVDVLTLTATPIPRTLQFSLLGARDMSIMTTPPPNRYPVQTEVIDYTDEDIIREAIEAELDRNGQVFVVNNRIEMLDRVERQLKRLCRPTRWKRGWRLS